MMFKFKSNKLVENLTTEIRELEEIVNGIREVVYGVKIDANGVGLDVQKRKDKDKGCKTKIIIKSSHFIIEDTDDGKEAVVKAKYIDRISGKLVFHSCATLGEKVNYCKDILFTIENHLETVNSRLEREKEQ